MHTPTHLLHASCSAYVYRLLSDKTRQRANFVGRDSPLREMDTEILRMVVEMVREKTGVQRWRFIQVSCPLSFSNILLYALFNVFCCYQLRQFI